MLMNVHNYCKFFIDLINQSWFWKSISSILDAGKKYIYLFLLLIFDAVGNPPLSPFIRNRLVLPLKLQIRKRDQLKNKLESKQDPKYKSCKYIQRSF